MGDRRGIDNFTDKVRWTYLIVNVVVVLTVLVGWLAGKDAAGLRDLLLLTLGGQLVGEASNVGKRATFKAPAPDGAASTTTTKGGGEPWGP